MDPITAAVVAAVAAGVLKVGEKAVVDAYNGLKALLRRKFGDDSEVADAVEQVERHPDSPGRQSVLAETVASAGAADDAELVSAAQDLLDKIGSLDAGTSIVQQVTGSTNVAQSAGGGSASVTVNRPTPPS